MKIKNIIKRATSAIAAAVLGATTLTSALVSAEAANPNPTHEATNITFSYTDGYIKYDAHAGYPYPNGTNDEKMWIIKLNNQPYANLCIHPGAAINSYTTDYYAYQVTSTGDANSDYWSTLTEGQRYTIGLLMYYGFPNGIDESGLGATSGAAMDATQMLVWEAVMNTRFIPDDYRTRADYSCYETMQYHWTGSTKDYQYTPLRDLYYKLGASGTVDAQATANTKAYYNYLVNKVVHHKDRPTNTYTTKTKAQANPITLKYNSSTKRYEATITTNEALFEDFGARTAIGNVGLNVDKQGATAANGNATYVVHTAKYFSGTKVTARMDKQSTLEHENRTPYGTGLQVWAQKLTSKTNPNDTVSVQQTVTGSKADPTSAYMAFNAQEVRGDFTVVKKSLKSNGDEDAVLVESVRKDARFMVYDVAAQRYIKTSIDAQGNYQYVSSDGFSNTSTNQGTIFKLNADGKFTVTNLPLGKTFRVIEYETAAHYEIPKATIEVTLDETNKSQTKEQPNKHTKSLYVSKRVLAASDDKNHINGKELAGASMAIVAEDGTTFAAWTSDGKEHIVYDVPAGKYTLKELAAPDGYQIATDIQFEIDENNKVTATGATVESKNDIPLIVMFDDVTRTDISKVDATTGKELAGAELKLYDWNDVLVESWTSTTEPHKVYGLVVGKKYTLIEDLAPLGYAKTTDVNFTVEGVDKNGKAIVTKVEMKDEVAKGSVEGIKVDEHDKPLENAVFGLFRADCKEFTEANAIMTAVSDKDGKFGFEKIPYGKYIVTELVLPDGYVFSDKKYDVNIRKDKQIIKIKAVNEEITLNISKKDVYGKELKGAKMQLIDKDGKVVDEWTSDGTVHVVKCLKAGKYTLKEVASPDGYIIATDIEFEIDKYNKVTVKDVKALATDDKGVPTIVMVDDTTKVKISKQDMTTGKELPGAKLQVLDENGNVVEEWTSSDKPHYIEAKLIAGKKYTLREVIAPNGYEKATDISFTVDEKGKATQVVMKDELTPNTPPTPPTPPDNPPQTGYVGNSLPIGILLGAVVMCVVAMIFARKKDDKNEKAD